MRLNVTRVGLNNAATSRIHNSYFINNCKFVFLFILCQYKFNFDFFIIQQYLIKSLFNLCFKFGVRTNQRLYHNLV